MSRDNGQGIFSMSFISSLQAMVLCQAQEVAMQQVDASSASAANKAKATKAIQSARSTNALMLALSNFSLSHQGMKVIR